MVTKLVTVEKGSKHPKTRYRSRYFCPCADNFSEILRSVSVIEMFQQLWTGNSTFGYFSTVENFTLSRPQALIVQVELTAVWLS